MKRKFLASASLVIMFAIIYPSLALAADLPAHVLFTANTPCAVTVVVTSYTDPTDPSLVKSASGLTPLTLDAYPGTPVTFYYPLIVVCSGVTYTFQSFSPIGPWITGASDTTLTVTGHYNPPAPTDTTPPTLHLPANMTVEATSASGAAVTYAATADDENPAHPDVSCMPTSGSTFALGSTTVNCSATDAANNTANGSFTVIVVDTTAPALSLPADMTVNASAPIGAVVNFTASANDLVDGPVPVTCLPPSGALFPFGTTTVNCTATDAHTNTANGSFTVTVLDDAPPVLTLPPNITVIAVDASGAPVSFTASATDQVDGPVAVNCSPSPGSWFPLGTTTVNCSAADSHGNTANGSFTVSVQYAAADSNCRGVAGHQILQPINSDGSSVFKQGRAVPAKFRVCGADGKGIGTPGVVTSFRLVQIISDGKVSAVDEAVLSTNSDTAFHSGNQQWIFNIDTKNLVAGNAYVYLITLNDGSTIQFQFTLR